MIRHFARATRQALFTQKSGPTLYDLCDPVLLSPERGDPQISKLYRRALANAALRLVLSRAGLPQLRDPARLQAVRGALTAARDEDLPDWAAIAKPIAGLIDAYPQQRRKRPAISRAIQTPPLTAIEKIIRSCASHLCRRFARNDYIPAYAAFNLTGDPDFRGREFSIAMAALEARSYRNATLLFNLMRVFLLANPSIAALLNPPWTGSSERMTQPVQIRHRSAYYDSFYCEALMDYLGSGLATPGEAERAREAIASMIRFCLKRSCETVRAPHGNEAVTVITAIVNPPDVRMTNFFWRLKHDLGFGDYVPDCDTTACAISAAARFDSNEPVLEYPYIDFFAGYQVDGEFGQHAPAVTINDHIAYDGGVLTWIENLAGDRPFGNDVDPTLNLDVMEVSFRNHARWRIAGDPRRIDALRRIIRFQFALIESGAFTDPRSHIYYLPELYCAYFARCHTAFAAMPRLTQQILDPDGCFGAMRGRILAFVEDEVTSAEMNPFDAALALLALAKLGAEPRTFAPALGCIASSFGEGRFGAPYKGYEWNKMKTPTRILVGGPEVTSAFVLSALVYARARLLKRGATADQSGKAVREGQMSRT
ncbi:MAG: hypothetical protein L0Y50_12590 [Beijerinckiaceae bacterium]|nr:hypothetical protein [Beijerinckiaceae bacterium]MCI0737085.1 hypothetical protein [Beijerinckiaceae bacterium]